MYDPSNYMEDLHINNEGDDAFLESVFGFLSEANTRTKAQRRANAIHNRAAVTADIKPPTPTMPKNQPKNGPVFGPKDPLTKDQRYKFNQVQDRIKAGKAIRDEKPKEQVDYKVSPGIQDVTPNKSVSKKTVGDFAKKNVPKLVGAVAVAAGKKMLDDYKETGDALHTAKEIKAKIDEKRDEKAAEKKRKKDKEEFDKWLNEGKKKKVLKENCELLIDESTGVVYHPFTVPEGA